ncbi:MAG: hypothetical protein G8D81_08870 [gamma proteobacterium symbiont of Clathrolucina costata]|uniref:Uncharacterized protein n=1 Tax=Candidatus Thiodiazotropha taylori TaxID=2792791 RepID=A0A9E4TWB5_9GAMM|nr:hypothetical protein [Candidatus Thiodiazotropha taylori]MCW4238838.1 hypothetical protein [Candidatus Thiodiazotropha endolucinida]
MDKDFVENLLKRVKEAEKDKDTHIPYSTIHGRDPDVEVKYILDKSPELAGAKPAQGMRCDFLYDGDDPLKDGTYSIAPELLDESENVIIDKSLPMEEKGKAYMWVGYGKNRILHKRRLKVGTKGYWVVGSKKLAKVTVTKILGLFESEA